MSTNCKIVLVVDEKDFNTKQKGEGLEIIIPEKKYMAVYCHWDGYPKGVGKTLLEDYDNYDEVLNLLLGGSLSSVCGGPSYYYPRDDWRYVCPEFSDTCPECTLHIEYVYKFENNTWYVRGRKYENNCMVFDDWMELKTVLENAN